MKNIVFWVPDDFLQKKKGPCQECPRLLLIGTLGGREHEVHVRIGRAMRRQRVLASVVRKEVFDAMSDNCRPGFVDGRLLGGPGGRDKG